MLFVVDHILQEFLTRFRTYKIATRTTPKKTPVKTTFSGWCLYCSFVNVIVLPFIFMASHAAQYKNNCTATALQRHNTKNSKKIFPEKELRGLSPNFHIHVPVSDLYIPTIGLPILLQEICGLILGIYKLLTDT